MDTREPHLVAPGAPHLGMRELRADLATHIRRAGAGERIVVTVDGVAVAQLSAVEPGRTPDLDSLAAAGLVRRPLRSDQRNPAPAGIIMKKRPWATSLPTPKAATESAASRKPRIAATTTP